MVAQVKRTLMWTWPPLVNSFSQSLLSPGPILQLFSPYLPSLSLLLDPFMEAARQGFQVKNGGMGSVADHPHTIMRTRDNSRPRWEGPSQRAHALRGSLS